MTDKTVDERAIDIAEPEGKTFYLCVTSSKAPMPIGTMLRANRKESGNYWFDEEMNKLNPVHGTFGMPVHWFSEITSDENVAVAIGKIRDEFEAVNAEHAKDVKDINSKLTQLSKDIDEAKKSGKAYSENFFWKRNTEHIYKDIFKMDGLQNITPLNGYILLWVRITPTTNAPVNYVSGTDTSFGISNSRWDSVTLVHPTDLTKPKVVVTTLPDTAYLPQGDDGKNIMTINVTSVASQAEVPA